jgi:uncharacterized repeat protein (TIGR02059 family)
MMLPSGVEFSLTVRLGNESVFLFRPSDKKGVQMLKTKTSWITLLSAAVLAACGGGGSSSTDSSIKLLSAETRNEGQGINLSFNGGLISPTLPATAAVTVMADGIAVPVTSMAVNGSTVDLVLARKIQNGQMVIVSYAAPAYDASNSNAAIQNKDGVDAAAFTGFKVANTVAALPAVFINGTVATPNASGEYSVSGSSRVTVQDSRVGSISTSSVDARGVSATTGSIIHSMSGDKYDVTFTNGPIGGVTSIKIGGTTDNPFMVIRLRWN